MLKKKLRLLFVSLMLSGEAILAQPTYFPFENYAADQFPDSYVSGILQDKWGYIWFASNEGLSKFNGFSFEVYKHDNNDPQSLADNNVNAIVEDQDGVLWVGTKSGLSRYDVIHNCFRNFYHEDSDKQSISGNNVWSLAVDPRGNVWAGTISGGLNKVVKETITDSRGKSGLHFHFESFQPDTADAESLSGSSVLSICFDAFNHGWVGTDRGLNRFSIVDANDHKISFTHFHANYADKKTLSFDYIWNIKNDASGNIWFTTYYGIDVLTAEQAKSNSSSIAFIRALSMLNKEAGLSVRQVYDVMVDSRKNVWIGTEKFGLIKARLTIIPDKQVFRFDSIEYFLHDDANALSLICNNVWSLYEDRTGVIWIGTEHGVSKYSPIKAGFNVLHLNEQGEILKTAISSLYVDKENTIWLGGNSNGIWCVQIKNYRFITFPAVKSIADYDKVNQVLSIFRSRSGDLYVGTAYGLFMAGNESVQKFTGGRESLLHFEWVKISVMDQDQTQINSITEDKSGNILMISNHELIRLKQSVIGEKGEFLVTDLKIQSQNRTLFVDSDSSLWVGTDDAGLIQLNADGLQLHHYVHESENPRSLSHNEVNCIYRDSHGVLWIGTANGLNRFNDQTKDFTSVDEQNGLPNGNIQAVSEDDSDQSGGNLWITTRAGLSRLNTVSMSIKNFDQNDGLNSVYFSSGIIGSTTNNVLLIGSDRGVNSFDPKKIVLNSTSPSIVISDFSILGKSIFSSDDSIRINDFRAENSIKLQPYENQFTVDFAALNFINTQKNRYSYQLTGFDKNWVDAGSNHSATYTNLNAGDYTLKIKAANNDGIWNEKDLELSIQVIPPWYKTWWFYALMTMLVAFVFYIFYRIRINQLLKLQTIRNRIASDLHDEIGSTLNSISVFSEVAKLKSAQVIPELDEIGDSSRQVIDAMSDIVWTINPENDSFEKILFRMRSLLHQLMKAKNIEYTFQIDEQLYQAKLPMMTRKNFYLIFKEAINNLVKYSQADKAAFKLLYTNHQVTLIIEDNGVGFDIHQSSSGNGIANMQRRASEIEARLVIESEINKGTTIELILKT